MDRFWTRSEASFQVRVGPNYERNKLKAESMASFYDVLEVRLFQFERKIPHASRYLPVPKHRLPMRLLQEAERAAADSPQAGAEASSSPSSAEGDAAARLASAQERAINGSGLPEEGKLPPELDALEDGEEEWLGVPRYLVMHFQVPMYEPRFFSKQSVASSLCRFGGGDFLSASSFCSFFFSQFYPFSPPQTPLSLVPAHPPFSWNRSCDGHNLSIVSYFRLRPDIETKLRAGELSVLGWHLLFFLIGCCC